MGLAHGAGEDGPRTIEVRRDGLRITALDWGGPSPTLLLLHGGGLCGGAFDPLARRLRDACRPVAVDLRGHGGSDAPRSRAEYAYAELAADVGFVLEALDVGEAVGLGNSLGGGVLLETALECPARFRSLLLCEAAATPLDPELLARRTRRLTEAAHKRRVVFESRAELVARYTSRRPFDRFAPECLEAFARWGLVEQEDGRFRLACKPEVEADYYVTSHSDLGALALLPRLASIPAAGTRSVLVRGRRSPFPEEGHQQQIGPLRAISEHLDCGHFMPHEDPAAVEGLVRTQLLA